MRLKKTGEHAQQTKAPCRPETIKNFWLNLAKTEKKTAFLKPVFHLPDSFASSVHSFRATPQ